MKWKSSQSVKANASANLPKLAEKYFVAGRKAVKPDQAPKQLHRFRIETKKLRYALELFRPLYGPTLDRHLRSLRGIQDALGKVSDYQTIEMMLAGDKEVVAKVRKARRKKTEEFREEWKKFDSDGQLKRWQAYLTGSRSRPGRAPGRRGKASKVAPSPPS